MTSDDMERAEGWRIPALRGGAWCSAAILAVAIVAAGLYLRADRSPPARPVLNAGGAQPDWTAPPEIAPADWGALRASTASWIGPSPPAAGTGSAYRLAGTFIVAIPGEAAGAVPYRKAILDDVAAKTQHLLGEGEGVNDLKIVRIHADRVVVDVGGRMEVLGLGFEGGAGETPASLGAAAADDDGMEPMENTRFGNRVEENRWVLNRDALMAYYRDILESPERVSLLYETFRPEYDDGKITGYQIDIQGEKDFFNDVGLKEGDTIRMVNSMKMTSQSRAEFFLGEFVKERLNAVVLDIERDGEARKIVYLIR